MDRMRRSFVLWGLCLATLQPLGCTRSDRPVGMSSIWNEYLGMPEHRALAIAGDPSGVWVAGATGGHPSRGAASDAALAECERRRLARGVKDRCTLFAVGNRRILVQ